MDFVLLQNVGEDDGSSDDEGMLCKFNFLFLLSGLVIVWVHKELCIASVSVHVIREVDFVLFFCFFLSLFFLRNQNHFVFAMMIKVKREFRYRTKFIWNG